MKRCSSRGIGAYGPLTCPTLIAHELDAVLAMAHHHGVHVAAYGANEGQARHACSANVNAYGVIAGGFLLDDVKTNGPGAGAPGMADPYVGPDVTFSLDTATLLAPALRSMSSAAHSTGLRDMGRRGRCKEPVKEAFRFTDGKTVRFSAEIKPRSHHMDKTYPACVYNSDGPLFGLVRNQLKMQAADSNRKRSRTREETRGGRKCAAIAWRATILVDQMKVDWRSSRQRYIGYKYAKVRSIPKGARVLLELHRRIDREKG